MRGAQDERVPEDNGVSTACVRHIELHGRLARDVERIGAVQLESLHLQSTHSTPRR